VCKVLVKAGAADEVVRCAEAVEGGEVIVYSLIDHSNGMFRCQIAVFSHSIVAARALAGAFCSEVYGDAA